MAYSISAILNTFIFCIATCAWHCTANGFIFEVPMRRTRVASFLRQINSVPPASLQSIEEHEVHAEEMKVQDISSSNHEESKIHEIDISNQEERIQEINPANNEDEEDKMEYCKVIDHTQTQVQQCIICLDNFGSERECVQLVCNPLHVFHKECIQNWVKQNPSCPVCRKYIKSRIIVNWDQIGLPANIFRLEIINYGIIESSNEMSYSNILSSSSNYFEINILQKNN